MKKIILIIICICASQFLFAQKRVGVGTNTPAQRLSVDSTLNIDQGNFDDGTKPSLRFGDTGTGEMIGSRRQAGGTNGFGIDFWTNSQKRLSIGNNGNVGIGNTSPGFALDVFDAANQGFFSNFVSNNANNAIIQIQNNNTATAGSNAAYIGVGMYRNGNGKAYIVTDPSNNLVLSTAVNGFPHIAISPAGNVGVGMSTPGFPLNFTNTVGDKISLYGNTGNSYGFGIQNNLLQIHSDNVGADVAIGYGSSASFTERMRIKGNGNVGIGEANPQAKLKIIQQGLYTRSEGQGNAIEITDTIGTDHTLYMGADAANQLGFIQSVATGGFRDLVLQPRGGNLIVGKDQPSTLAVKGDLIVDNGNANTGTANFSIRFGGSSGETIGSKRNAGGNQNGLDFYTASTKRMGISNSGNVDVVNNLTVANGNGIIRNNSGTQLKMVVTNLDIDITSYAPFQSGSSGSSFAEAFSAPPVVYIGNVLPNPVSGHPLGDIDKLMLTITGVTATGFSFTGHSTHNAPIVCSGRYQIIAIGPQ